MLTSLKCVYFGFSEMFHVHVVWPVGCGAVSRIQFRLVGVETTRGGRRVDDVFWMGLRRWLVIVLACY